MNQLPRPPKHYNIQAGVSRSPRLSSLLGAGKPHCQRGSSAPSGELLRLELVEQHRKFLALRELAERS